MLLVETEKLVSVSHVAPMFFRAVVEQREELADGGERLVRRRQGRARERLRDLLDAPRHALVRQTTAVDLVEQEADGALMDWQREVGSLQMGGKVFESDGLPIRKCDDLVKYACELAKVAEPAVTRKGVARAAQSPVAQGQGPAGRGW